MRDINVRVASAISPAELVKYMKERLANAAYCGELRVSVGAWELAQMVAEFQRMELELVHAAAKP